MLEDEFGASLALDGVFHVQPAAEFPHVGIAQAAGRFHVVGGSALSGFDVSQLAQPWPVGTTDPRKGYSDVGFRLAFSTTDTIWAAQLKRLLIAQAFLTE